MPQAAQVGAGGADEPFAQPSAVLRPQRAQCFLRWGSLHRVLLPVDDRFDGHNLATANIHARYVAEFEFRCPTPAI